MWMIEKDRKLPSKCRPKKRRKEKELIKRNKVGTKPNKSKTKDCDILNN